MKIIKWKHTHTHTLVRESRGRGSSKLFCVSLKTYLTFPSRDLLGCQMECSWEEIRSP